MISFSLPTGKTQILSYNLQSSSLYQCYSYCCMVHTQCLRDTWNGTMVTSIIWTSLCLLHTYAHDFLSIWKSAHLIPFPSNLNLDGDNVNYTPRLGLLSLSEFWIHLRQKTILQIGHWDPIFSKSVREHGQAFSFCLWSLLWPFLHHQSISSSCLA
jgi:hypothetical protein